jgi:hypothetical protein
VEDPFEMQRRDKVVTRAIYRSWEMKVELPGLGQAFSVQPLAAGNPSASTARGGAFSVRPGVYLLSAEGPLAPESLPARLGTLGFREFHAPPPDPLPTRVVHHPAEQHALGQPLHFAARVVSDAAPDSVLLWLRPRGRGWYSRFPMTPSGAYDWQASVPAQGLREGPYDYLISVSQGDSTLTFPEGVHRAPSSWDFSAQRPWSTLLAGERVALPLLRPGEDAGRLAFSRIGDGYREGIFRLAAAPDGEAALHLELPVNVGGINPEDYTASLVVLERVAARAPALAHASGVRVRLRGVGARQRLFLTLMEKDGSSWSAPLEVGPEWEERTLPLSAFTAARGVKLPQGFPGTWNYWVAAPPGRGGAGDALRLGEVERLQLSLRREPGVQIAAGSYGVEVESVALVFE